MPARVAFPVLLVLAVALPARAQEARAFRVSYAAPPGCPSAQDFAQEIQARTARARLAQPGEPAIEFTSTVSPQGEGALGLLQVQGPNGNTTTRVVPGATCTEVASAMALIAAIIVDPDAATQSAPVGEPALPSMAAPGTAPPVAPDTASVSTPTPPREPAPTVSPGPMAPSKRDRVEPLAPAAVPGPPLELTLRAELGLFGAIAPGLTPGFGAGLELGLGRRGLLVPAFGLSVQHAESSATQATTPDGNAEFLWTAGRLMASPLKWPADGSWSLRPWAFFEAGQLRGKGVDTGASDDPATAWLAAGILGRAEVLLLNRVTIGVQAGATFPFRHDLFYFDPGHLQAHRIDTAGFLAAGSVGVRIL